MKDHHTGLMMNLNMLLNSVQEVKGHIRCATSLVGLCVSICLLIFTFQVVGLLRIAVEKSNLGSQASVEGLDSILQQEHLHCPSNLNVARPVCNCKHQEITSATLCGVPTAEEDQAAATKLKSLLQPRNFPSSSNRRSFANARAALYVSLAGWLKTKSSRRMPYVAFVSTGGSSQVAATSLLSSLSKGLLRAPCTQRCFHSFELKDSDGVAELLGYLESRLQKCPRSLVVIHLLDELPPTSFEQLLLGFDEFGAGATREVLELPRIKDAVFLLVSRVGGERIESLFQRIRGRRGEVPVNRGMQRLVAYEAYDACKEHLQKPEVCARVGHWIAWLDEAH